MSQYSSFVIKAKINSAIIRKKGRAYFDEVQKKKRLQSLMDDEDEDVFFDLGWNDLYEDEDDLEAEEDFTAEQKKRKRPYQSRSKKAVVQYKNDTGVLLPLPPTMSLWYSLYCQEGCKELTPRFEVKFRRRFRLPYDSYIMLLEQIKEDSLLPVSRFKRWRPGSYSIGPSGKQSAAPLDLLLLTSLRYLGRGWTFDDLEEVTAISEEVIRVFYHRFIEWGSTKLFEQYVKSPETVEEATEVAEKEYRTAGFPGCVGSMDGTHVEHSRISFKHRQAHLSFKLPFTARTYNLCCSHRRKIFCTTHGHPARWNDKSLVRFDQLAVGLHEGTHPLCNLKFWLYEYNEAGNVVKEWYRGGWLLTDNGYLNWGVTIPPLKEAETRAELRFSKWLEGMRKDVECTFGIMKGRWRVLKAGIRLQGTEKCDQTWKTCCALHNLLLTVDGMDKEFKTEWTGTLGQWQLKHLPVSVRALLEKIDVSQFDNSGMGRGDDTTEDAQEEEAFVGHIVRDNSGAILVRKMNMSQFRERLIIHFDIAHKRKEISWPVLGREGEPAPDI